MIVKQNIFEKAIFVNNPPNDVGFEDEQILTEYYKLLEYVCSCIYSITIVLPTESHYENFRYTIQPK